MRHPSRRPRPRLAGVAGLALALLLAATSRGQETSGDQASLARYVPKDGVILYLEYDGLDAHADAWKKTAACKILNDTPTGAMLETVAAQLFDKLPNPTGQGRVPGTDQVALIKHMARSGFLFALVASPKDPTKPHTILVFRNAFKDKAIRPIVARGLQEMNAPNTKPQAVVRAGHKVVSGTNVSGGGYAWWVEETRKEDLVEVFPSAEAADTFLETLDGKRPNATAHPRRAELVKSENGFVPTGIGFVDPIVFASKKFPESLGLADIKKFDYRWGFQDDALMTITRLSTASPRKGLLALLDGSTFDKGKLPPIPESVTGFTVMSLDLNATLAKLTAFAKTFPEGTGINRFFTSLNSLKDTSKLTFKGDILAHLGPKVTWYVLPAKSSSAPMAPNMLSMMMAGAGMDQIPKLAVVFDVDDPVAFGKVLDEAMAAANRIFKAQASKPVGDAPQPKEGRNRGPGGPSYEFRLMPGDAKMYVLQVPPELAGQFPASLRPSIRVGPKHAVLAVSAEVARMALEAKGAWNPPGELVGTVQGLSSKLKMLDVSDPRETLPGILAALPGKLQSSINTAILLRSGGAVPPGGPGNPAVAGPGGPPGGGRAMPMAGALNGGPPTGGSGGGSDSARSGGPGTPGASRGSGGSGSGGSGGAPGPGGPMAPGAPGAASPPGGAATFTLQVDPSKVPSADSIKALLFPSIFTVEVDDGEIRITTRGAFPSLPDPSKLGAAAALAPSMMGPGGPPPGLFPPPGGPPPPGAGPVPAKPGTNPGVNPQ